MNTILLLKLFMNIYIYISGINISALMQEIIGCRFCFHFFFLENYYVYLDAERLYDQIKQETFQIRTLISPPRQARAKQAQGIYCARRARSSNTHTKVPACAVAFIISFQTVKCCLYHFISNSEKNYVHSMS